MYNLYNGWKEHKLGNHDIHYKLLPDIQGPGINAYNLKTLHYNPM